MRVMAWQMMPQSALPYHCRLLQGSRGRAHSPRQSTCVKHTLLTHYLIIITPLMFCFPRWDSSLHLTPAYSPPPDPGRIGIASADTKGLLIVSHSCSVPGQIARVPYNSLVVESKERAMLCIDFISWLYTKDVKRSSGACTSRFQMN